MIETLHPNADDRLPKKLDVSLVSVTRFRARSVWILPIFILHAHRAIAQLRTADGYIDGAVRRDTHLTFWTMTLWRDEAALQAYVDGGAHGRAMPSLHVLASEAAVVRWVQEKTEVPDWATAERRLRAEGHNAALKHPAPAHGGPEFKDRSIRYAGRL